MTSSPKSSAWDLSPVFGLIQSLSLRDVESVHQVKSSAVIQKPPAGCASLCAAEVQERELGNFDTLWDFLGVQRDIPPPKVPTFEASTTARIIDADAYTSDGALYYPPSAKSVKWRDEEEGLNLTDVQPDSPAEDTSLTKNQRKKRNRKARRAAEAAAAATPMTITDAIPKTPVQTSKSEKELDQNMPRIQSSSEASRLDTTYLLSTTRTEEKDRSKPGISLEYSHTSKPEARKHHQRSCFREQDTKSTTSMLPQSKSNDLQHPLQVHPTIPEVLHRENHQSPARSGLMFAEKSETHEPHATKVLGPLQDIIQKQWATTNRSLHHDLPSTPQTPRTKPSLVALSATATPTTISTPKSGNKRFEILPFAFNSSVDRHWSLLLKLMQKFPEDRAHLLSPLQLSINRPTANGIHVFVDASNIFIGFHDTLKRVRGIPQYARVPRVNLNFHSLALLLERRRPITKRVLAGSTPEISAFDEARQVGYETCILDKVWKSKELTERQRRFAARETVDVHGYNSGSETAGTSPFSGNMFGASPASTNGLPKVPQVQQPKWVEQAVDEILHLKILESIVDTPSSSQHHTLHFTAPEEQSQRGLPDLEAAPTMVLATGDAAEAEYSSGFMKMVQRALEKGWKVEIVAWSKSVSADYRRLATSASSRSRFKIIELDDYAEELFGEPL